MASLFRPALELLAQYAAYHRDRRNIVTHFVGVPMVVFAIGVILSKPGFVLASWALTPAWLLFGGLTLWYLTRGEFRLGLAASIAVGVLVALAHQVSGGSLALWLTWGLSFFVVGWIIQLAGHYYEGRKPAFVDDLTGLLVGPMFVTLEVLASLGLFRRLLDEVEGHVGPPVLRNLAHPA